MNYAKRFKEICNELKRVVPAVPKPPEMKYKIHKRSLPVEVDKVVVMGVTKPEAVFLTMNFLKTKIDGSGETDTVIYYDIVREDDEDVNVLYNPKELII